MDTEELHLNASLRAGTYQAQEIPIDPMPRHEHSPLARLEASLARIAERDPVIQAVVALDDARARADAINSNARWTSGAALSAVDGMPIMVKANIAVAGLPWTGGIGAWRDRIALHDAACVARLRAGGAIVLGTTNMDEGALGDACDNPWFGRTDNPRAPGYSAGGSSGGSAAAVAARYCDAALGTDTIGSVRIPAAYCGVIGYKPARGVIPMDDVIALSPMLDCVGVLADTVATARAVASVAAARIEFDPAPLLGGIILAILLPAAGASSGSVDALTKTAQSARELGLTVVPVAAADFPGKQVQRLAFMVAEIEGAIVHRQGLRERPDGFSPSFAKLLDWGAKQSQQRYGDICAELDAIRTSMQAALAEFDALLTLTALQPAFAWGCRPEADQASQVAIASVLGGPATAFPAGRDTTGLPLSCQIVSADAPLCLALAEALTIGDWSSQR